MDSMCKLLYLLSTFVQPNALITLSLYAAYFKKYGNRNVNTFSI